MNRPNQGKGGHAPNSVHHMGRRGYPEALVEIKSTDRVDDRHLHAFHHFDLS